MGTVRGRGHPCKNETVRISCRTGVAALRKLAQHFGKQTRVTVVARSHKGKVLLSVKDVPLEQMEKLREASRFQALRFSGPRVLLRHEPRFQAVC